MKLEPIFRLLRIEVQAQQAWSVLKWLPAACEGEELKPGTLLMLQLLVSLAQGS